MVKNSRIILILTALVSMMIMTATNVTYYTDEQIFALAEKAAIDRSLLPAENSQAAPAIDPEGKVVRTIRCNWLTGRPTTPTEIKKVVCRYQSDVWGDFRIAEDGASYYQWHWLINDLTVPAIQAQIRQLPGQDTKLNAFLQIVQNEMKVTKSVAFNANYTSGLIFTR